MSRARAGGAAPVAALRRLPLRISAKLMEQGARAAGPVTPETGR